jgi:hypothetical protein
MPAKFSLSFLPRRNLARSRRNNFPASPVFSKLESGDGVNLPGTLPRTPAEFDRAVRHRVRRRQKAESLDPNFQHSSLQLTSKRPSMPSLNRLAGPPTKSPRESRTRR